MTFCRLGNLSCTFGEHGKFAWSCENKAVEAILNRSFIFPAPPEDADPFLTIAQKACRATGMVIVKNKPPAVSRIPEGTVV
jgi:hypothetical protein